MLGNTRSIELAVESGVDAGRSIEAILARRSRRLRARVESFAPDFLHGEAQLDEIYEVLGASWVEQAVFVEPLYNRAGKLLAVSVAYFNDYFLTIEQAVSGEVENVAEWLEERMRERKTRVELVVGKGIQDEMEACFETSFGVDATGIIPIFCSQGRLHEMEVGLLSVTRDGDMGNRENFEQERESVLQDSRTNLLSLITLAARLIAE